MSDNATRETVGRLYDAYRRHDLDGVAALLHDDIDWIIYGPIDVFPYAGVRRGPDAVLGAVSLIFQTYSIESLTTEVFIVEDDRAAIMLDVGFKQLASGRVLRFRAADFLRVQEGRLVEYREFADTFDLVEQAVGHAVDV